MNSFPERYKRIREQTELLAQPLFAEDTVPQPTTDVSPPKWHLAHTTWFFENFILKKYSNDFQPYDPHYDFLFNSYYKSQGDREARNKRGFHSRPTLNEVLEYRNHIDRKILELSSFVQDSEFFTLIELGLQHEQQHQELFLTDLKYIWSFSPYHPVYAKTSEDSYLEKPIEWLKINEGIYQIGITDGKFHFDNESPNHKVYIYPFEISDRITTAGEYIEFIEDGGYGKWEFWLHEGFHWVEENKIDSPMYWNKIDGDWYHYTLSGLKRIQKHEVLTHINYYEADAFARWKGMRLPTESEWETACLLYGMNDSKLNTLESGFFHPRFSIDEKNPGFLGQTWEWTSSAYLPYPGFKPWKGGIGEYNGKFMINQMVLRGGSCFTPESHIRPSYRNFFHPHLGWQATGLRLVRS
ncbi:MAG: ergothioneine biosynthesis protein EgtB [Leptospiraceae bacterium]|nr:ergothioneine biosynthesis protein EgtB [Leptospiraceae bacterium]